MLGLVFSNLEKWKPSEWIGGRGKYPVNSARFFMICLGASLATEADIKNSRPPDSETKPAKDYFGWSGSGSTSMKVFAEFIHAKLAENSVD